MSKTLTFLIEGSKITKIFLGRSYMNIQVQICSLIIIVLLYIIYRSQRTMGLYQEKVFKVEMHCAIATLSFDILSIVGIHYRDILPTFVVHALCKMYLCAIMTSGFGALFYVLVGLVPEDRRLRLLQCTRGLLIAQLLGILFTSLDVYEVGRVVYSEGPAVVITYGFTIFYILVTLIVAIAFLYRVNRRRALAVILWMGIWIIAAAIQFMRNDLLLVGFAGGMGMVILYVMLEAPETYLDKQFGCFNSYSFDVFCKDRREYGKLFSVMEVFSNEQNSEERLDLSTIASMKKMIEQAFHIKGINVFKNVDSSLFLTAEDPELLRNISRDLLKTESSGSFSFILLTDSEAFSDSLDLMGLLSFCRHNSKDCRELLEIEPKQVISYREEERMVSEIRSALQDDRVLVYLQPIFCLHSDKFETAEALVRIRGKDGNLISPALFIPVAERVGLITELGERIFEKVCQFIAKEDPAQIGVKYIEVNLSVVQCEHAEMADQMCRTMNRFGIAPSQVNFEITETGSVSTKILLLQNMNRLKQEGSSFSLDDFGKGESNLIYLVDMPVSILKMDYDLTKAFYTSEKAKQVIFSIVDLAHKLGMKVVAEGVETRQELDDYRDAGVDYIQGFYFSRPMPMDNYLDFVRLRNSERIFS